MLQETLPPIVGAATCRPKSLPLEETPLLREMSRSDRGFAVFARKNVGFADKRVAAPAKGEVETEGFDRGDYPCIKDRSSQYPMPRRAGVYSCRNLSSV